MIDTLLANMDRLRPPAFWHDLRLEPGGYFVMTLHRPSNVDAGSRFMRLLEAIGEATRGVPTIFPVHPRTRKTLESVERASVQRIPGGTAALSRIQPHGEALQSRHYGLGRHH